MQPWCDQGQLAYTHEQLLDLNRMDVRQLVPLLENRTLISLDPTVST